MITDRDMLILRWVAIYWILTADRIIRLGFPRDPSAKRTNRATEQRVLRKRLQVLCDAGLLRKLTIQVVNGLHGFPGVVYVCTPLGLELLAAHYGDPSFLCCSTKTVTPLHEHHALRVIDFHILLDQAAARTADVTVERFVNEWDVVDASSKEPGKKFALFVDLDPAPRRLVCKPDAGVLMRYQKWLKVRMIEVDRNTDSAERYAASKARGYAELQKRGLHRKAFPEEGVHDKVDVLMISPNARRRDALRRAFVGKEGADLWLFASWDELTAENLLFEPIFWPAMKEQAKDAEANGQAEEVKPRPLVRRAVPQTVPDPSRAGTGDGTGKPAEAVSTQVHAG